MTNYSKENIARCKYCKGRFAWDEGCTCQGFEDAHTKHYCEKCNIEIKTNEFGKLCEDCHNEKIAEESKEDL